MFQFVHLLAETLDFGFHLSRESDVIVDFPFEIGLRRSSFFQDDHFLSQEIQMEIFVLHLFLQLFDLSLQSVDGGLLIDDGVVLQFHQLFSPREKNVGIEFVAEFAGDILDPHDRTETFEEMKKLRLVLFEILAEDFRGGVIVVQGLHAMFQFHQM